jgi:hypothetical protein
VPDGVYPPCPQLLTIRRIVDDSIGLTEALTVMVGAIFLLRPCNDDVTMRDQVPDM